MLDFPSSENSPFLGDLAAHESRVAEMLGGSRVLLIGGAGTIGSATLRILLRFNAAGILVVDTNENGLAEVVRDVRNRFAGDPLPDLQFAPVDYGSPIMRKVLNGRHFDHVLNFAALKHVRSERDVASTLRMLEVNFLGILRLMRWLSEESSPPSRVFSVSTDKASDPVNLMGASKRLMEAALLDYEWSAGTGGRTSARFANVAFSAGSLLESWRFRLEKGHPLACPVDTRRFFISRTDAGRLCVLSAFCLDGQTVGIPSAAAGVTEWELEDVARWFLERHGYDAVTTDSEKVATASVGDLRVEGKYPLLLTRRDTTGEKEAERFSGAEEEIVPTELESVDAVRPAPIDRGALERVALGIEQMIDDAEDAGTKKNIVSLVREALPQLRHTETGRFLDDRM